MSTPVPPDHPETETGRDEAATPRIQLPSQLIHQFLGSDERPRPDTLPFIDDGRYSVEAEHARGGLGRILKAQDHRLVRPIAIKQLIDTDKESAVRFVREALVSARLQHPAIVPIYDAGRWPSGELFYAMKLISGRSLDQVIGETHNLSERLALLPHVIAVADAVAYAHSQQVIHRDLKPANVLIGPFGETVVIDWGLAKDLLRPESGATATEGPEPPSAPELTVAGTVMGTPEYMPPEQADALAVDERADVYALGAMLYHVLAGAPPYGGRTSGDVLMQVRSGPPRPLVEREAGVPQELATIVAKAMARRPEERYPSAQELAEELRRFQTGQLVSAHRYSRATLLGRWLRRHRAPVMVAAACLAILAVFATISVRRILRDRVVVEAQNRELLLVQARTALDRDPTAVLAWLKTYVARHGREGEFPRDLALDAVSRGVALHILRRDEPAPVFSAFSPDGRLFAGLGTGKRLALWDTTTGHVVRSFACHDELDRVAFAPDGQTIAFVQGDGTVTLGEVANGRTRVLAHVADALSLAFSPDGQFLLVGSGDHLLQRWTLATGERATLAGFEGFWGSGASFAPDGRTIAFAHQDGAVWLWQAQGGTRSLPGQAGRLRSLAFSPDGRQVVASGEDKRLRLWDVATGQERVLAHYQAALGDVAFSPDSRWVAASTLERQVRIIEAATGRGEVLGEHLGEVYTVAFSPDGRFLATAGQDATVRLWEIETGERWVLQGHGAPIYQVLFSPDGRLLASISEDRTTRLWTVPAHRGRVLRGHEDDVRKVAFSPDGRRVATASRDGSIRLWDAATGQEVQRSRQALVRWFAFTPDGQQLVSANYDGQLLLWDLVTLKTRELGSTRSPIGACMLSPDGRSLATGSLDGAVRLWDVATGAERKLATHQGEVHALRFSPDGQLLASGGVDRVVLLSDVATGTVRALRGHVGPLIQVVFSPDGRHLASTAGGDGLWLWDTSSGQGRPLVGREARVQWLAFSPDDRWIAGGSEDGRLGLWNRLTGEMHPLYGHSDALQGVFFLQGGRLLASTSLDGTLRLWDVNSFSACRIERHDAGVLGVALTQDERILATSSVDKTARLWRMDACPALPSTAEALGSWLSRRTTVMILEAGLPGTP